MSDDVDVLRALHDVRVLLAPLTRRRDVTFVLTGCDALPRAAVDERNLGRLLYKLFTVAIRNTPLKGTVRVAGEVVRADGASARPLIQIAISDPGPGATLGDFERLVRSINPVEILGAEQRSGAVTMTAASGLGESDQAGGPVAGRARGAGTTPAVPRRFSSNHRAPTAPLDRRGAPAGRRPPSVELGRPLRRVSQLPRAPADRWTPRRDALHPLPRKLRYRLARVVRFGPVATRRSPRRPLSDVPAARWSSVTPPEVGRRNETLTPLGRIADRVGATIRGLATSYTGRRRSGDASERGRRSALTVQAAVGRFDHEGIRAVAGHDAHPRLGVRGPSRRLLGGDDTRRGSEADTGAPCEPRARYGMVRRRARSDHRGGTGRRAGERDDRAAAVARSSRDTLL